MSINESLVLDFADTHSSGTPGYLTNGSPAYGTIGSMDDIDFYQVYLAAGTEYLLYLNDIQYPSGAATNDQTYFGLYSPSKSFIGVSSPVTDTEPGTTYEAGVFEPSQSGVYYVAVLTDAIVGDTGSYVLIVSPTSDDDHIGDEVNSTLVVLGAPASGSLEIAGDDDCFGFNAVAGQRYVVENQAPADFLFKLTDFFADTYQSAVGQDAFPAFTAPDSDMYFVHVLGNTFTATGSYELVVTAAASNTANFVAGGSGNDVLAGTAAQDEMHGGYGSDSVSGGDGNDYLFGGAGTGNDTLNGGAGADTMAGGAGNDTYIRGAGDTVTELLNQGIDLVKSSASYILPVNLEKLTLTGTSAVNGTGNTLANTLSGNPGANTLKGQGGADVMNGLGGADKLYGGAGNDKLTGGTGNDKFVFDTALNATSNKDTILDFATGDKLWLDNDIFTALGTQTSPTNLPNSMFWAGTAAHDPTDRIIYDSATGALYYDSDGAGGAAKVQFALIGATVHPALVNSDFQIIA